ncbi:MAG: hypothetical protein JNL98_21100 [Bryobacterales bacterium]|nr:hypothetical protein [Bryobacterales bacterium]
MPKNKPTLPRNTVQPRSLFEPRKRDHTKAIVFVVGSLLILWLCRGDVMMALGVISRIRW